MSACILYVLIPVYVYLDLYYELFREYSIITMS
jgi:hypothetical protein